MRNYDNDLDKLRNILSRHWNKDREPTEEDYWSLIYGLTRNKRFAIQEALKILKPTSQPDRFIAADILGQACNPIEEGEEDIAKRAEELLIEALQKEDSVLVQKEIVQALGYLPYSERLVKIFIDFSFNKDLGIRAAATRSLLTPIKDKPSDNIISRLIALSSDLDTEVRDWATFGLGTQCYIAGGDSLEIRKALRIRMKDSDAGVQAEALMGLAYRKDAAGIPMLRGILNESVSSSPVGSLEIEAAGTYGVHDFYDALIAISKYWKDDQNLLRWAIERCSDNPKADLPKVWNQ